MAKAEQGVHGFTFDGTAILPLADGSYTLGSTTMRWSAIYANAMTIYSANGIDINPGSDVDIDVITLGVTGDIRLRWDESEDRFHIQTAGLYVAASLTVGVDIVVANDIQFASDAAIIRANNNDDDYLIFQARDNGNTTIEVARLAGAADPYFSMGGSQQWKFYNSGIVYADSVLFMGDSNTTAEAVVGITTGIQIDQGAADNALFVGKSSDVAQLFTGAGGADADTYVAFLKAEAAAGGLLIRTFKSAAGIAGAAFNLQSYLSEDADNTKSTAGRSIIEVYAAQASGTAIANVVTEGNIFGIRARVGAADIMVAGVDEDGDLWLNGRITTGGAVPLNYVYNFMSKNWTSEGGADWAASLYVGGTITGHSGDSNRLCLGEFDGNITLTGNTGIAAQFILKEPNITLGGNTATVAATLYVLDAPDEGTTNAAIYVATGNIMIADASALILGTAGAATGKMEIDGATSGTVTVTVNAIAGTWTLTLPADAGANTEQLATNGAGVTDWAAAGSLKEFKDVHGVLSPGDALDAILGTKVYLFNYKRLTDDGRRTITTLDYDTVYAGVMGDEAPWVMQSDGKIFTPISAFGYTVAAFRAIHNRIETVEDRITQLEKEVVEAKAELAGLRSN